MPLYIYTDGKETVEVIQKMDEPHVFEKDGIKYDRVFTVAQTSIDTKLDPFSATQFVESSAKKVGSVGDLFEKSRELSEKRVEKTGRDELKENYYKTYAEKRGGKIHPDLGKKEAIAKLDKLGVIYE